MRSHKAICWLTSPATAIRSLQTGPRNGRPSCAGCFARTAAARWSWVPAEEALNRLLEGAFAARAVGPARALNELVDSGSAIRDDQRHAARSGFGSDQQKSLRFAAVHQRIRAREQQRQGPAVRDPFENRNVDIARRSSAASAASARRRRAGARPGACGRILRPPEAPFPSASPPKSGQFRGAGGRRDRGPARQARFAAVRGSARLAQIARLDPHADQYVLATPPPASRSAS